jgi:capsule polysaccharide export protein KpsE/RkpR
MAGEITFGRYAQVARHNWKTLAFVALVAAVVATVASLPAFMPPKYMSRATVYPVNLSTYSTEARTDQLLQLLESNSIRDSLIRRFDLALVYDVDTTANGRYFALYNEFEDRVEVSKTLYESVMVEVMDEDPVRARDMVKAMLEQTDLLARRLQREKSYEVLAIAKRSLDQEKRKLDSVEQRLVQLRQASGLLVYEGQTSELTRGYLRMLSTPGVSQARLDEVRAMFRNLEENGGEFRSLTDLSNIFRHNYARLLGEYERLESDVLKELTYTNVVVYPEISDKKVYPVRWLILLLSVVSSVFMAYLLLIWRDQPA